MISYSRAMATRKRPDELRLMLAIDEHYFAVSRLLTRAAEAFTIWWFLHHRFVTHSEDPATMMYSDLLEIIAFSCRRTGVVTLAVATDNKPKEYNVNRLLNQIESHSLFDVKPLRKRLARVSRTIKKIRIVRNNVDAHLADNKGWRMSSSYGTLQYKEVRSAMLVLFRILKTCAIRLSLGYERLGYVERITQHYCKQMMRGFKVQHETGKITFLD